MIDLRSDTVTRPTAAMRASMAAAQVGDDVFGEDPTVNELCARVATLCGHAAGLLLPSGTQANLVAVLSHCGRGDALLTGEDYHVHRFEAGGASVLGGVAMQSVPVAADGGLDPDSVAAAVRPADPHFVRTRLLCLENTHGGRAVPVVRLGAALAVARRHALAAHLDGARLFNAAAALDCPPAAIAAPFDSVSVCLSKSLGCPAGTVLCGSAAFIAEARHWRKMLGGAMRQSGVLAAAGLYALDHHVDRLRDDHDRAGRLAIAIQDAFGPGSADHATSMVHLRLPPARLRAVIDLLEREHRVRIHARGRIVLHLDIDEAALQAAIAAFRAVARRTG